MLAFIGTLDWSMTIGLRIPPSLTLLQCILLDFLVRVPEDSNGGSPFDVLWFDGDCNDEHTKQSIIQTTLDALNNGGPSFTGQGWKDSQDKPLTVDDFEVFCGPKVRLYSLYLVSVPFYVVMVF